MASLNKVMLIGNLTRDPEVRYTPKGSAVCDLAIAVNRTYATDSGEKVQETIYVDVVVWARLAEVAGQYLKKGSSAYIEGRLQMDTWEDKQTGQKRSKLRVVAENLQFLDSKGVDRSGGHPGDHEGGGGGGPPQGRPAPRAASSGARPAQQAQPASRDEFNEGPITEGMEEDDIPF